MGLCVPRQKRITHIMDYDPIGPGDPARSGVQAAAGGSWQNGHSTGIIIIARVYIL